MTNRFTTEIGHDVSALHNTEPIDSQPQIPWIQKRGEQLAIFHNHHPQSSSIPSIISQSNLSKFFDWFPANYSGTPEVSSFSFTENHVDT